VFLLFFLIWLPLEWTTLGCFLGCSSLRGPDSVSGTVGGSLSVRCQYKEVFRDHDKYWCKSPCVWKKIVETTESQREVTKGRVSIRDHPADLTFTVTLKSLTEGDAGTYKCGIDTLWWVDPTFSVVVSVNPGELCTLTFRTILLSSLMDGEESLNLPETTAVPGGGRWHLPSLLLHLPLPADLSTCSLSLSQINKVKKKKKGKLWS
uniref:Immunoglobulin domain-containing protein n=1 Tax=Canis lupus familiaris TaxID=9615 RepID=A0A8C0RXN2_CANLF